MLTKVHVISTIVIPGLTPTLFLQKCNLWPLMTIKTSSHQCMCYSQTCRGLDRPKSGGNDLCHHGIIVTRSHEWIVARARIETDHWYSNIVFNLRKSVVFDFISIICFMYLLLQHLHFLLYEVSYWTAYPLWSGSQPALILLYCDI